MCCSPWGSQRVGHNLATEKQEYSWSQESFNFPNASVQFSSVQPLSHVQLLHITLQKFIRVTQLKHWNLGKNVSVPLDGSNSGTRMSSSS